MRLGDLEAPWRRAITEKVRTDLGGVPRRTGEGTDDRDFFHVDTVLLRRLYVLVFIHRDTRLVRIAGITKNPVASWVTQQARNLSMELADQTNAIKFLVRDRDSKFTTSLDAVFAAEGIEIVRTPWRTPKAKGVASYCTSWRGLGCFSLGESSAA